MLVSYSEIKRIFTKIHGFRDSPTCLLEVSNNSKIRINEENFVSVYFDTSATTTNDSANLRETCFFRDFNKTYFIE